MATALHNLSEYDFSKIPDASNMCFGIVVAEWNPEITGALLNGTVQTLEKHGALPENIHVKTVPGSFELTYGSAQMVKSGKVDAVIAIGCVVRGDTPHFDYVCQSVTQGVTILNALGANKVKLLDRAHVPVIFSVLTVLNQQQALDRCGGKLGNKGVEGAYTAMRMANL